MKQTLLHFIWEHSCFQQDNLCSQTGEPVTIIHPGYNNEGIGPDFLQATIRIGEDLWTGGVVLQVDGAEWYNRRMDRSSAFGNVILHVAYRNVRSIYNGGGHFVPTLELNGKIPEELIERHENLDTSEAVIACAGHLRTLDQEEIVEWRDRLLIEQFKESEEDTLELLNRFGDDWEKVFLFLTLRHFAKPGTETDHNQFAGLFDLDLLLRHRDNKFVLEAILLGQAGLLHKEHGDMYLRRLFTTYQRICKPEPEASDSVVHVKLDVVLAERLSFVATLLHKDESIFQTLMECTSPKRRLKGLYATSYWRHFVENSLQHSAAYRERRAEAFIIRCLAPLLYTYGQEVSVPEVSIRALELLQELSPEHDKRTSMWELLGVRCVNAADSMAFSRAVRDYCLKRRCLQCPLGCKILAGKKVPATFINVQQASYLYN